MTLDIAAIKARADAATDARFSLSATYFDHVTNMWLSGVHIDGHAVSGPAIAIKGNSVEFCNALRAFIAHARTDIPALLAALEAAEAERDSIRHEFKNFHRMLCERFDCHVHDEIDWQRDQVSLMEWIAKRITAYRVRLPADDLLRQAIEALRVVKTSVSPDTIIGIKIAAVLASAAERGL